MKQELLTRTDLNEKMSEVLKTVNEILLKNKALSNRGILLVAYLLDRLMNTPGTLIIPPLHHQITPSISDFC